MVGLDLLEVRKRNVFLFWISTLNDFEFFFMLKTEFWKFAGFPGFQLLMKWNETL